MHRSILLLSLFAAPALSAQAYTITHTATLGGEGGWDYVVPDPPNHRVFIGTTEPRHGRRRWTRDTCSVSIAGINGAHGTALARSVRAWLRNLR